MKILKKSTATTILIGPFVDATDGKTPETALTISQGEVLLWKEGGTTMAQKHNAASLTHRSNGYYTFTLDVEDVDTNGILHITAYDTSGDALPVHDIYYVVHANTFDGMIAYSGLGSLANVVGWNTSAIAAPDTAGYPKVTIKSGSGTGEISLSSGGVSLTSSERAAVADAVFDEDITTHRTANSAGAMFQPLHSGACQAGGSTTTVVLASGASSTDDYYNGDLLVGWVTADGTNKFADYISDYVGSTRTATVTGIPVSPGATYSYVILPGGTIPGASAPSASDNAAAVWNALTASYTASGSFGERFMVTRRNTLGATGTSSELTLDAGASTTADYFKLCTIQMLSGTCAGQSRQITAYSTGRVATVDPAFIGTPASGDAFLILPFGIDATTVATIVAGVWNALRADHNSAGTFGEYTNADVLRIAGNTTSAGNVNNAFNGTGFTFTGCTMPTVTSVTNMVTANATQISGDATAADYLEAMLDGTGGVTITAALVGNVTGNLSGSVGSVTGAVGSVTGAVGSVTGAVGSVTGAVTVGTNNDKTGYRLSATGVDDIWDEAITEPASVFSWAAATPRNIVGFLGQIQKNKGTLNKNTGAFALRNSADSADVGTATHADDGTTTTKGIIS